MTEVISVKFKSMGKTYFFAPNGNTVATGDSVVIETAKGLEMRNAYTAIIWWRTPVWCSLCGR